MGRDHLYVPNGILKRFGYSDVTKQNIQIHRLDLCKDIIESIDTFDESLVRMDFFEDDLDTKIRGKVEEKIKKRKKIIRFYSDYLLFVSNNKNL